MFKIALFIVAISFSFSTKASILKDTFFTLEVQTGGLGGIDAESIIWDLAQTRHQNAFGINQHNVDYNIQIRRPALQKSINEITSKIKKSESKKCFTALTNYLFAEKTAHYNMRMFDVGRYNDQFYSATEFATLTQARFTSTQNSMDLRFKLKSVCKIN
jgi:hypothetical protein